MLNNLELKSSNSSLKLFLFFILLLQAEWGNEPCFIGCDNKLSFEICFVKLKFRHKIDNYIYKTCRHPLRQKAMNRRYLAYPIFVLIEISDSMKFQKSIPANIHVSIRYRILSDWKRGKRMSKPESNHMSDRYRIQQIETIQFQKLFRIIYSSRYKVKLNLNHRCVLTMPTDKEE